MEHDRHDLKKKGAAYVRGDLVLYRYVYHGCCIALVNSFEIPVTAFKSYSWYAGVQDALVQWWYGHNAVAFFLTTPYLA
jgi:cbb3-type cytochrome oxidase subunit 1